jgi:hydroxyacid-oxoacid transhydrogenase
MDQHVAAPVVTAAPDSRADAPAEHETVFAWIAPPVVFGAGALDEAGAHVAALGVRRAAIVTDPGVAATGIPERVATSLRAAGVAGPSFDRVHVEPTDASMREAVAWARQSGVDGFVAVGGGSVIDTAKAMNLLSTNDGEIEDYLNKPVGRGLAPSKPLKPLIALPTTAGTGAEATSTCVINVLGLHVKTAIAHRSLLPRLAIVDPLTTLSLPPGVTASSGMDILCHALESWTARPFDSRPRAEAPAARPAYNGANPISDVWCARAMSLLGRWFRRVMEAPSDLEARTGMMLAALYAGVGFGNAGVHIPHASGYPVAGMVRDYHPADYPADEAMVPHGQSVVMAAPAAFRFTFDASPERHVEASALLGGDGEGRDALPRTIVALSRDVGIPSGLAELGYGEADVDGLVEGAMRQQRILAIAPRPVGPDDLAMIFRESMRNW